MYAKVLNYPEMNPIPLKISNPLEYRNKARTITNPTTCAFIKNLSLGGRPAIIS